MPRMAEVAKTCPLEPQARTTTEAATTIRSMMQMGFRMKRSRPLNPMNLERQPALHNRTRYSIPKNVTRQISCGERE